MEVKFGKYMYRFFFKRIPIMIVLSLFVISALPLMVQANNTWSQAYTRGEGFHPDEYVCYPDCGSSGVDQYDYWTTNVYNGDQIEYYVYNQGTPALVFLKIQCLDQNGNDLGSEYQIGDNSGGSCAMISNGNYGVGLKVSTVDGWGDDGSYYDLTVTIDKSNRDRDFDGVLDHNDAFPSDSSEWSDYDNDGYGDNEDDCKYSNGDSYSDRKGCIDSDWDGYSDPDEDWLAHPAGYADAFPYDGNEYLDTDDDDYGDNSDACPQTWGTSFLKVEKSFISGLGPLGFETIVFDEDQDLRTFAQSNYPNIDFEDYEFIDSDESDGVLIPLGEGSIYYLELYLGCLDSDGDGIDDSSDQFDDENTQWVDSDGDGYGDNLASTEDATYSLASCYDSAREKLNSDEISIYRGFDKMFCLLWGESNPASQLFESDYNLISSSRLSLYPSQKDVGLLFENAIDGDHCPLTAGTSTIDRLGCLDSDGDGVSDPTENWNVADGADAYPDDSSQWSDRDLDGYGDNLGGTEGDSCPNQFGTSTIDRYGCLDSDDDGYSDPTDASSLPSADNFPNDATQWNDADLDGYGDNQHGSNPDAFINDSTQWLDSDGDGFGDNQEGLNPDAFINNSTQWLDLDGDGFGDNQNGQYPDAFINDSSQWLDVDGDGFGDNPFGTTPDSCPNQVGDSTIDLFGCLDSNGDGYSDQNGFVNTVISKSAKGDILAISTWLLPLMVILVGTILLVRKKANNDVVIEENKNSPFANLPITNNQVPKMPPAPVAGPPLSLEHFENPSHVMVAPQNDGQLWDSHYDENGKQYYSNSKTGETTWDKPF